MNSQLIKKLLSISFTLLAILVFIWTILWFIKLKTATEIGIILISIIFLATGIYAILIFIGLILAYLLTKFIIKKIRRIPSKEKKLNSK